MGSEMCIRDRKKPGHTREPSWRKQQALAGSARQATKQRKKRSGDRACLSVSGTGVHGLQSQVLLPALREGAEQRQRHMQVPHRAISDNRLFNSRKPGSTNQHDIILAKWEVKKGEAPGRKPRLEKWRGEPGGKLQRRLDSSGLWSQPWNSARHQEGCSRSHRVVGCH